MFIYLVRHAQSEGNSQGFFQGNIDSALTPTGERQARWLAEWLKTQGIAPQFTYTSPLRRASHTAQIISEHLGAAPAIPTEALREYRAGSLEGLMTAEVAERFPEYQHRSLDQRGDFSAYGGESYDDMQARLRSFIAQLEATHETGSSILVVSHGGAVYQLLKLWCGWPTPRHYFTKIDNCTCFKLAPREIAGVRIAELHWMVPLELMGWQADGGQAGATRADWIERQ